MLFRTAIMGMLSLATATHAVQVTRPSRNERVDPSAGFEVTWTTVATDPSTAHMVLVNQAGGGTPYSHDLGEVQLADGRFTVRIDGVAPGAGFQINVQSAEPGNSGILSQSEQFEVAPAPGSGSSTNVVSSSTPAGTATVTSTASVVVSSVTLSGSASMSVVTTLSAGNSTGSLTTATVTGTGSGNGVSTTASGQPTSTVEPNVAAKMVVGPLVALAGLALFA